jgi:hypothetical protein
MHLLIKYFLLMGVVTPMSHIPPYGNMYDTLWEHIHILYVRYLKTSYMKKCKWAHSLHYIFGITSYLYIKEGVCGKIARTT